MVAGLPIARCAQNRGRDPRVTSKLRESLSLADVDCLIGTTFRRRWHIRLRYAFHQTSSGRQHHCSLWCDRRLQSEHDITHPVDVVHVHANAAVHLERKGPAGGHIKRHPIGDGHAGGSFRHAFDDDNRRERRVRVFGVSHPWQLHASGDCLRFCACHGDDIHSGHQLHD